MNIHDDDYKYYDRMTRDYRYFISQINDVNGKYLNKEATPDEAMKEIGVLVNSYLEKFNGIIKDYKNS